MSSEPEHTITQCNQKLVVLLDKLNSIDTRNTHNLPHQIDDCKSLARELSHETKYLYRNR
jgi:hypothetical protein